jgi:intein/homing endonuclease
MSDERTKKWRPFPMGVSIGNYKISAGTASCIVEKNGKKYVLSNNHVLSDENRAPIGSTITQPGPYDIKDIGMGKPEEAYKDYKVAELSGFVEIKFPEESSCLLSNFITSLLNFIAKILRRKTRFKTYSIEFPENELDVAIALPISDDIYSTEILGLGISPKGSARVKVEEEVVKSGRTTGVTKGIVISDDATIRVGYDQGEALFVHQILIQGENFVRGGDSVSGDARMYYLENGNLKFGTVLDVFNSFKNGNKVEVLSIKKVCQNYPFGYPSLRTGVVCFSKVIDAIYHGIKPVWKITLHNGKEIEVTKDHSLFSIDNRHYSNIFVPKTLEELDNVVTVEDYGFEGNELNISDDLLILLGLWIADGSYERDDNSGIPKGIAISTGNEEGIVKFLTEKFKFRPKSKGDYRKYSVELVRFIYNLCGDVDCYSKRVPNILFTTSKRQIGLFLKGYFSGDGSIHPHEENFIIVDCASVNRKLLEDIQILLNRLGIRSNIDAGYIPTKFSKRKQYKLKIEGKINVEKFLKQVGLLKKINPEYYDILNNQGHTLKHDRAFSSHRMRGIEYIGEKPVFDFKVNPTEIFIANGLVCHNSGSAVLNLDGYVVGLIFAGSQDGSLGIANHIYKVEEALGVKVCSK